MDSSSEHNRSFSSTAYHDAETQRRRVEGTLEAIGRRLTFGQLLDEVLMFGRDSGGTFVNSFGRTVRDHPIATLLIGVGVARLLSGPTDDHRSDDHRSEGLYPGSGRQGHSTVASIKGNALKRVSEATADDGNRVSEFIDESGARFRLLTDKAGRRIGHFTDEAGRQIRHFVDEGGARVRSFLDETGNALSEAESWISEEWDNISERAEQFGEEISDQTRRARHAVSDLYSNHPLVLGALAFAAGAAIGSSLPRDSVDRAKEYITNKTHSTGNR